MIDFITFRRFLGIVVFVLDTAFGTVRSMEKKDIAKWLRDYHWMINRIVQKRKEMDMVKESTIAQYGIESILPKGKGNPSDPVYFEVMRRERKWRDVNSLEKKVLFVQKHIGVITDDKEKAVLNCILDGMSLRAISRHMELSLYGVREIRNSIVDQIYRNTKAKQKAQKAQ